MVHVQKDVQSSTEKVKHELTLSKPSLLQSFRQTQVKLSSVNV